MSKKSTKSTKLTLNPEKVANLSEQDLSTLVGGGSTCAGLTCSWCTSTMSSRS
ncbi:TIGR04149 family rSAM-modified RiPP [Spirosoma linguale]|uniref:Uncharacterized protein n=1 Tax=Spirosoma linguale (strain ATCC 33905 / DSM 74 / LMG 10896 / Claus 1) TaxID=504472 RepID=D2QPM5_SPILD|nr:hypothetical protein Slin_4706 [Spirosoma linguale DSM 74]ADB40685.1 hypothetical protein Slin_4707 [Spirosoma linguale DSM 74]